MQRRLARDQLCSIIWNNEKKKNNFLSVGKIRLFTSHILFHPKGQQHFHKYCWPIMQTFEMRCFRHHGIYWWKWIRHSVLLFFLFSHLQSNLSYRIKYTPRNLPVPPKFNCRYCPLLNHPVNGGCTDLQSFTEFFYCHIRFLHFLSFPKQNAFLIIYKNSNT